MGRESKIIMSYCRVMWNIVEPMPTRRSAAKLTRYRVSRPLWSDVYECFDKYLPPPSKYESPGGICTFPRVGEWSWTGWSRCSRTRRCTSSPIRNLRFLPVIASGDKIKFILIRRMKWENDTLLPHSFAHTNQGLLLCLPSNHHSWGQSPVETLFSRRLLYYSIIHSSLLMLLSAQRALSINMYSTAIWALGKPCNV